MATNSGPGTGKSGLQGTAELVRKLQELGKLDEGKALKRAVRDGMRPALKEARVRIPVGKKDHKSYLGNTLKAGHAKKSLRIVTQLASSKKSATALLSTDKEGFYAPTFVELGTSKMAARPWLRPAFYATSAAQRQALNDSLAAYIEKVAKSSI